MAAELRERIKALLVFRARIAEVGPPINDWYVSNVDELSDAILALLPQPSPGEYGPLIEEARRWAEHEGLGALVKRLITRLADALSSALRERDTHDR